LQVVGEVGGGGGAAGAVTGVRTRRQQSANGKKRSQGQNPMRVCECNVVWGQANTHTNA